MSATKAIYEMCKMCIYDQSQDGTWRAQIEACTSPGCPLFAFRPMTQASIDARRKKQRESK